jgi:uncharacterized protein
MNRQVILDTGPLVAFISPRDQLHDWAVAEWATISTPLLTCEAVITEACFLLRNTYQGENEVMNLIENKIIHMPFDLEDEVSAVRQLLIRYQSVPMSLADACLVRMIELYPDRLLLTMDSDFMIYRRNQNQPIALSIPTF